MRPKKYSDYQVCKFLNNFLSTFTAPLGNLFLTGFIEWNTNKEVRLIIVSREESPLLTMTSDIHMLILLGDALGFGKDSDTRVTWYTCIDEIITCQEPTCIDNLELLNLVNRQVHVHRHSLTCRKNTKSGCQFNYPQPPTRQAQILLPQDSDNVPQSEVKMHKDRWKSIKKHLSDISKINDQGTNNWSVSSTSYM